jgi:hypothetical protein
MTEIGDFAINDFGLSGNKELYAIWFSDFEFAWNNRAEDKCQKTRQTLLELAL